MNLLQLVQSACRRIGILAPNAVMSSTDPQIIQLLELSNEEGRELAFRYPWQALQREATFTTVATQVQTTLYAVTTLFSYIVNDTIWNRDLRRPVYGPNSQQDWQQAKAMQINGPFNRFRIIQNAINFYPIPTAGQHCYFEYLTSGWVMSLPNNAIPINDGLSDVWTNDEDLSLLDDDLLILGMVWRWKAAKGLAYAEDFNKYEARLLDLQNRDAGKQQLNMAGAKYDIVPAVLVPAGSWN